MTKLITKETLQEWDACEDSYEKFCKLFPVGATLQEASAGLIANGKFDWSNWLWEKCAKSNDFEYVKQTHVIAGDFGTATAGRSGTATVGYGGTATAAGNDGTAIAGPLGTATADKYGTATVGYGGNAIAGYKGTATAGYKGTATAGYYGTAIVGDFGTATVGYKGTATVGALGTATAGDDGMLVFKHVVCERYIVLCANVGIDGIKADTPYHVVDGKIVEKESLGDE